MIPFAATLQRPVQTAEKIANAFEWPRKQNPRKLPLRLKGSAPPSNTWFRGLTQVFVQNDMSIGSVVCAQRTVECPITLQWAATFPPKHFPFPLGDRVPIQHMVPMANPSHQPKLHLDWFSRFCVDPKWSAVECSVKEQKPKIATSPGISSPRRRRTEPQP